MTRRETKSYPIAGLKAIDTETGQFEAIVSVFGNVDLHGHRIDSHAFDASLERWRASGDPIPVIFSHQWDDLSAYLGTVDPNDVKALQPGDSDLPAEIRDFGGLYVAGQLDTSEPEGRKAAKLLKDRIVREFSFAYEVFEEERGDDGYLELLELDIFEIGPTLKGANPLTQLIAAKARDAGADFDRTLAEIEKVFKTADSELEALARDVASILDGTKTTDPEPEPEPETAGRAAKFKAWVQYSPEGTIEAFLGAVHEALVDQALDRYAENLYTVAVEGTYSDGRVLFYVELWDEPVGGGSYYEATFEVDGETVEIGEWAAVELEVSVSRRGENRAPLGIGRGTKEGRRNATADANRIQGIHDLTRELGADCETADEDPDGTADEDEDEDTGTESRDPWSIRTSLEAELLEL